MLWGVEEIFFVEWNVVFGKELDIFVAGSDLTVMLFLSRDVTFGLWAYGLTDGESTVSTLPCESDVMGSSGFKPFATDCFHRFHHFGQ